MDAVWSTLRTLGVLLALWVVLAVVGIAMGVVPIEGLPQAARSEEPEAAADGGVDDEASDAGPIEGDAEDGEDAGPVADLDAGPTSAAAATPEADDPDADEPEADDPEAPAPTPGVRWTVCDSSTAEPSLAVAPLFGDPRPEIVVGCAGAWHVLGLTTAAGETGLSRVAVLSTPPAPSEQRARLGRAAIGDVDGDGHADLVLPFAFETAGGASRGGALHWVPGSPFGGIREPTHLAPIAAVAVALGGLDAQDGADLAAMNRTNALAQLPSEAWVFTGGAAPARQAALPVAVEGSGVWVSDVDRDGHADVITLSQGRVDMFFGDGAGAQPRNHTLALEGARELAIGDLDGDGGGDLVVLGPGLRWIRAGALEGMEPHGIDGVPATLRGLEIHDVDSDGKVDIVGWDHPRLVVLAHQAELSFEARTALTLAGGRFGPRRHRVVDLDGDGVSDDLVLLGTTAAAGAPLELVLVLDALEGASLAPAPEARAVPDAPLVIRADLEAR